MLVLRGISLVATLARAPPDAPAQRRRTAPRRRTPLEQADLDLVACVLAGPDLVSELGSLVGELGPVAARILEGAVRAVESGRDTPESLVRDLFARCAEDADARAFLADAQDRATRLKDARSMFPRLRRDRELHFAREEANQTKMLLMQAIADGDSARADQLTKKFHDLLRRSGGASHV